MVVPKGFLGQTGSEVSVRSSGEFTLPKRFGRDFYIDGTEELEGVKNDSRFPAWVVKLMLLD